MSKIKLLLDVVSDLRSLADSVQAVADAMTDNAQPVADEPKAKSAKKEPATPKLTIEDVRAVLVKLPTRAAKELLQKYDSEKLSGIDPEKYADLLADATRVGLTEVQINAK